MALRLSICIPVYNCGEFLGATLDSILPQAKDGVEVIVYDGGSTDNTSALMQKYLVKWPELKYFRNNKRGGIDVDMAAAVDVATGDYCWLFSGDDLMRPSAIKILLQYLEMSDDVYICQHTACTKQMEIIHDHPILSERGMMRVDLCDLGARQQWFAHAVTTEAFFSFMSGLVVLREKWQDGQLPPHFVGSCWGHVARLFGLVSKGLRVCYVPEVLLDKRGENDSFADKGVVHRYSIAIDGYHKLADTYWGHGSIEAKHIRRVVRNEFGLIMFLNAKILCLRNPENESLSQLTHLFKKTYGNTTWLEYSLKYAIYRLMPSWFYEQVLSIFRQARGYKRGLIRGWE